MSEEFTDLQTAPKMQIQATSEEVVQCSMHDPSFSHPDMPAYVSDSMLFEGQRTGYVITPWMFSALTFPGPDQIWPVCKVSERIGLCLPYGEMIFTVGGLDGVPQHLSCSLMSSLSYSMSVQKDACLTDDCARMLLSLPVNDSNAPQLSRRVLLLGRRDRENI